jgi:vacuolar-type H+-ATPase subunit F/Vma7
MSTPVFVGDEVSAAGFRLAGLRVRVPNDDDLIATIEWACGRAPLVLIGAETAQRLSAAELDEYLSRLSPPVVIVPDVRGAAAPPDIAKRLRQQLGMLE